jgi:hypothetical protein
MVVLEQSIGAVNLGHSKLLDTNDNLGFLRKVSDNIFLVDVLLTATRGVRVVFFIMMNSKGRCGQHLVHVSHKRQKMQANVNVSVFCTGSCALRLSKQGWVNVVI